MVLTAGEVTAVLQRLADADWGTDDWGAIIRQVRADDRLRLFGPLPSPPFSAGIHYLAASWDNPIAERWAAASLITGEQSLDGKVWARVVDCRPDGCTVLLDVRVDLPENAFRLSALAFDPRSVTP